MIKKSLKRNNENRGKDENNEIIVWMLINKN